MSEAKSISKPVPMLENMKCSGDPSQYLCLHFPEKPVSPQLHVQFQHVIDSLIKTDVYLFKRVFKKYWIPLTTPVVLLPVSCTQEAIFHLMATNNIYEQNTLNDHLKAMLLITIPWTDSRHYKSVSPSELLNKEKIDLNLYLNWMYVELNVWVTISSWQPPWL